jgi:hypothetical protein
MDGVSILPELLLWRNSDETLANELGGTDTNPFTGVGFFGTDTCRNVDRLSHFYKNYMPLFHATPLAGVLRDMIREIHSQKNFYGRGRKIMISAFKPMVIKTVQMYVRWYAIRGNAADPIITDNPPIWRTGDFCFRQSWADSTGKASQVLKQRDFASIDQRDYKQQPWLMVASGTAVMSGQNLAPADCIIQLDTRWGWRDIVQISGRVSRSTATQKNPFTEFYWLLPESSNPADPAGTKDNSGRVLPQMDSDGYPIIRSKWNA